MKKHTYIIPYYKEDNEIYILLGKKKFYSHKDGFIHSNANQLVLIGGHLEKKYKNDIISNIQKEFLEETGYKINKTKISLLDTKCKDKCYFVGIYKCNKDEYGKFSDFNNEKKDNKFVELNNLIWVKLNDARKIMSKHNSSLNIRYMANDYVYNFIKKINEPIKWYSLNELKHIYKKYNTKNLNKKDFANKILFPQIINNDKVIIDKVYNEIYKYIKKNSYYDWFIESIQLFENTEKTQKTQIKNKKKYIPPHLRK